MTTTPRLGITQLEEGQALPESVVNEGVSILEMFATRLIVKSQGDTAPPGSPAEGDAYLLGTSATGAWSGHDDELALRINGAWEFIAPKEGFEIEVEDEDTAYVLRGGTWVAATGASIEVLDEGASETATLVSLDFVGAAVSATDDGSGNVTVSVSGGSNGVPDRTIVRLAANASKTNNDFTVHSWVAGDIVSDSLGAWASGTPSRFTCPAGMTQARITICAMWASNSTGARWAYARVNANNANVVVQDVRNAINESSCGIQSIWITGLNDTTDYFDITFAQSSGGALNLTGGSGFATATRVMIEWAP